MTSPLKFVASYVALSLTAIAVLALWPFSSERLLVIMPGSTAHAAEQIELVSDQRMYSIVTDSGVQLIEKLGRRSFVVTAPDGEGADVIDRLYQNGAFLVLNAAGLGGCGEAESPNGFRRAPNDRFARTSEQGR